MSTKENAPSSLGSTAVTAAFECMLVGGVARSLDLGRHQFGDQVAVAVDGARQHPCVDGEHLGVGQVAVVTEGEATVAGAAEHRLGVAPGARAGGGVAGLADGQVTGSGASTRSLNTLETSPMSLTTVMSSPSLTAMPADSWPRCWSAYRPR